MITEQHMCGYARLRPVFNFFGCNWLEPVSNRFSGCNWLEPVSNRFSGCNWLEPVSNRFSGYFRSWSGYFWISKKGNRSRSRLVAQALKNRTLKHYSLVRKLFKIGAATPSGKFGKPLGAAASPDWI